MLDFLRGRVTRVGEGWIVLDVGGLGIRVRMASTAGFRPGKTATIHSVLDIQTRRWTVFGFPSAAERDSFAGICRIPGIGAATALKLLPRLDDLKRGKTDALASLPGIGPAKLKRIARWLKRPAAAESPGVARELKAALRALGMPPAEAKARAERAIARKPGAGLEELIRAAVGVRR